jgi:hypothetical protein
MTGAAGEGFIQDELTAALMEEANKGATAPLRVEENDVNAEKRLHMGNYAVIEIRPAAFMQAWETQHGEPLAWSAERAEALRNAETVDGYPFIGQYEGRLGVEDGRHRIAEAARRGQESMPVAVDVDHPAKGAEKLPAELVTEEYQDVGPEPAPAKPSKPELRSRMVARVRQAIDWGEDIRLRLEKLGQEVYGGTRAQGAFEMRDLYEAQEAAVNGWLRENSQRLMGTPIEQALAEINEMSGRLATQTVRNKQQIDLQQFRAG